MTRPTLQEFIRNWNLPPNVPVKRCRELMNIGNTKFYQMAEAGKFRLRKNGRNTEIGVEELYDVVIGREAAAD